MNDKPCIQSYEGHWPEIHESVYLHPRSVIIGRVTIGAESSIWPHTTLRGDDGFIKIGARTSIQDGTVVHLTGALSNTTVGDQVTVGHNVTLHGATVADNVLIGMGAIILDNAEIGAWSLIGAGALVTQNTVIPEGSLVLGAPAKVVRPLRDKEREQITNGWQTYVANSRRYLANS